MDDWTIAGMILGGLALLGIGGELVVRGSVGAARRLQVSPVVVGVVLMGFGTSLPELVTSLRAALDGQPGLALGNVVGSNIANVLLIAGVAAALAGAARTRRLLRRDGIVLAAATTVFVAFVLTDTLAWWSGLLMLAGLALYLLLSVLGAAATGDIEADVAEMRTPPSIGLCLAIFAAGVAATIFGADYLVQGAIAIAETFEAPPALIGATIVAVGTSLPELAATIAAARQGQQEMAIGNVFGSNVFNTLGIVGVTAIAASPLPAGEIIGFDLAAMAIATVAILWFAHSHARISRGEGLLLLAGYIAYLVATTTIAGVI